MRQILIFISLACFVFNGFAQKELLQSGPVLGYSEMREVKIWVQTKKTAEVKIRYINIKDKNEIHWTDAVITQKNQAFTAKLTADEVEPGNRYKYTLYINNKAVSFDYETVFQTLPVWKWRGDAPDFSFITGSGAYINETEYDRHGKPYGGDYQIFTNIAETKADFMLWLGDNVYLREPDWNSQTGIFKRNTHTRSTPEMQKMFAVMHHYAIWDDHDYGPNDSDRGYAHKDLTLKTFELFWPNPAFGVGEERGVYTFYNWNDCEFFLLDNRYYRSPDFLKEPNKTQLGEKQKQWLKDALIQSDASFKFIALGGQFLNTSGKYESYGNYGFADERNEIIEFIQKNNIKNVVFLTGDRHLSEVSVLDRAGCPKIYDITTSPFSSGPSNIPPDEVNPFRVSGSLFNQHIFAKIDVSGTLSERKMTLTYRDADGKILYTFNIQKEK
jgi:alkaline phosphatase D